jgi:chromosome partitioning protein
MEYGALRALRSAPHVIVVGSGKGGSGKTTLAMHVVVYLLKAGQRIGTLDLDSDQRGLTRYIENRERWARHRQVDLALPWHKYIGSARGERTDEIEARELAQLQEAIASMEASCDFLVIDLPSHDNYLMGVAHLIADTVLTPLQDSFLDLGALGLVDPLTHEVTHAGHYAATVRAARRLRRQFDPAVVDWIVILNRSCDPPLVRSCVHDLALQIGFKEAGGCAERAAYRQLFALGLTAFDALDEAALGTCPSESHLAAEREMRALMENLRLPVSQRGLRQAAARSEWLRRREMPLVLDDIVA